MKSFLEKAVWLAGAAYALLLVFPYLPGPVALGWPISALHYPAVLGTMAAAPAAVLAALVIGAFAFRRRDRKLARLAGAFLGFALCAAAGFVSSNALVRWSAGRAMRRADRVIAALEELKGKDGRYPDTLTGLGIPLDAGSLGMSPFRYERFVDEYKLSFMVDEGHFNYFIYEYRPSGSYPADAEDGAWREGKWSVQWVD